MEGGEVFDKDIAGSLGVESASSFRGCVDIAVSLGVGFAMSLDVIRLGDEVIEVSLAGFASFFWW